MPSFRPLLVRPSSAFFALERRDATIRRDEQPDADPHHLIIIKRDANLKSAANMTSLLSPLLSGLDLDKDEYIGLLTKLIGESVHVQNNPRQGLVS